MQITNGNELLNLKDNEFIGEIPKLTNSQININGKNNTLVCEEDVTLWNSRIDFNGNNSILYLSSNKFDYAINISINENNICFIGKNNFFNGITTIVLSESRNVISPIQHHFCRFPCKTNQGGHILDWLFSSSMERRDNREILQI